MQSQKDDDPGGAVPQGVCGILRKKLSSSLRWTWHKVRSGPKEQTNNGEQDNAGEHSHELQTQQCVQ